jgi:hypothetical protein
MREKRAKKGEKARKMTERKMGNMHFLEAGKAILKGCGKKAEKDRRRREKGRKKGEKGEKVTEKKMDNIAFIK